MAHLWRLHSASRALATRSALSRLCRCRLDSHHSAVTYPQSHTQLTLCLCWLSLRHCRCTRRRAPLSTIAWRKAPAPGDLEWMCVAFWRLGIQCQYARDFQLSFLLAVVRWSGSEVGVWLLPCSIASCWLPLNLSLFIVVGNPGLSKISISRTAAT